MAEEDLRKQVEACHRLKEASQQQFQAVEKSRIRAS